MSLTLNTYPTLISLSENPVIFKILTDNIYSDLGVKAFLKLKFNDIPEEDDTFTISWSNEEIIFVFKDYPDNSGKQLQTYTSVNSLRTNIVAELEKNYILSKYFNIQIGQYSGTFFYLEITAKDEGEDYTINLSDVSVTGLTITTNTSGEDVVSRDFYDILIQVFVDDEKIGEEVSPPDSDLISKFDISEYITPELSTEFSFLEDIDNLFIQRTNNIKEFYIKYAERYGNTPEVKELFTSDSFFALLGGISDYTIAKNNDLNSNWLEQLDYSQKFLTNQPIEKTVYKKQIEKLYYLTFKSTTTEINLNIKLYFNDDTNSTIIKYTESVDAYQVYEMVMTYNKLELDDEIPIGLELLKYDIWLTDQDGLIISETRTYILENIPELFNSYFLFRNSLSGYDTLRTTGLKEKSFDTDSIYVEQILDDDFSAIDREKKTTRGIRIEKYKCFTGWKSKEYINYLQELIISEDVYEIIDNNIIPIIINKNSINLFKDDDNPYAFSFNYERAFIDRHYDNEAPIEPNKKGDFNSDFNNDFTNPQITL